MPLSEKQVSALVDLCINASEVILEVYNDRFLFGEVEKKSDHSPLTLADKRANELITQRLQIITPDIPVISEEGADIPFEMRSKWDTFWLVDPLDGTREFLRRNGEFTVNLGLVVNKQPVHGFIAIPAQKKIYYTLGSQSYCADFGLNGKPIRVSGKRDKLISIGSRSHASEEETKFLSGFDIEESISAGSSLKFCYIAEGRADLYYRHNPTMEWDTAAGHALVINAGGHLDGLAYNKAILKNGAFCCYGYSERL